jgi:murein DD-endopeptidase MepM/ murein hydrolase activator NlpD
MTRLNSFRNAVLTQLRHLRSDLSLVGAHLLSAWQTQPALHSRTRFALGVVAATFGISAMATLGIAPMIANEPAPPVQEIVLNIEPQNLNEQAALLDAATVQLQSHVRQPSSSTQGMNNLLTQLGIDDDEAADYLRKSALAQKLFARSTRSVSAQTTDDGTLQSLRMLTLEAAVSATPSSSQDFSATDWRLARDEKSANGFSLTQTPAQVERRLKMARGVIRSSLFAAADEADVPDSVAVQLAEIFDGEIDFRSDLRRGDEFQITYEQISVDGEPLRAGRLIAALFINKGQRFEALWFKPSDGATPGYYTFNGKSLRQAFLRTPLEFSRISSGFGGRTHPISHSWKQHKGVDFSAPTGTAIRAASDGTVKMAGRAGSGSGKGYTGYGNVIELEHRNGISTLYGHLSAFAQGVSNGAKVKQGDVIGFVGTTGWSTGPHLHYEFRVKGEHVNPMTVALPEASPITPQDIKAFAQLRDNAQHQLAMSTLLTVARAK